MPLGGVSTARRRGKTYAVVPLARAEEGGIDMRLSRGGLLVDGGKRVEGVFVMPILPKSNLFSHHSSRSSSAEKQRLPLRHGGRQPDHAGGISLSQSQPRT